MNFDMYFHKEGKYLEIGPLDNPFLKKSKYNVKYLDYNDTKTVKSIYANSYANLEQIVDIDFATFGRSYKETVEGELFDGVYSSHVIEHTYDLIGHLKDIADILNENGIYYIVLPDKTHYADFFRQATTFREVFNAYKQPETAIAGAVADSVINVIDYNTLDFHNREVSLLQNLILDGERKNLVDRIYKSDDPGSLSPVCHKWVFDETTFLEIIRDCMRFQLIPFCVEESTCTSNESNYNIYIALRKRTDVLLNNEERLKEIIRIEKRIEILKELKSPLLYICDNIANKKMYIYGAGVYGVGIYKWLKNEEADIGGFLVSDGQEIKMDLLPNEMHDSVIRFSEFELEKNYLVIVAVRSANNRKQIESLLNDRGMLKSENYVCV